MHLAETLSYFNKQVRALLISGEILHTHTHTHRLLSVNMGSYQGLCLHLSYLSQQSTVTDSKLVCPCW